jgi:hypothetical protein
MRPFAIGIGPPDVPRYAAGRPLLPPDAHEFVNKMAVVQGISAGAIPTAELTPEPLAQWPKLAFNEPSLH